MIGRIVTDKDGNPVDGGGKQLSPSAYQPSPEVMTLFAQVQTDYQLSYTLQHRPFAEFDDMSLLQRARADQQTFGAYVGAEYLPDHKKWRWRGRKNTARNKLIGILAHMIAGILFPTVFAKNDQDEEDKDTARVMGILIEDHLKKADYENKFLYMVLSALVNPAVIVQVEYVEAMQRVKTRLADGTIKVEEAVDELLSGLNLWIVPVDEFLVADFFTNDVQRQPYILRVRRIPWDEARKMYGQHPDFKFVQAGRTRIFMTGQENQTLFDIQWTEADQNYVQEITAYYRPEDLEVTFVGGVFMGNPKDIYNSNPFTHRRFTIVNGSWGSVPIYPYAVSGFEPLDPSGRFFYYKSGAFKEYWDDKTQNKMHQLLVDGTYLDVFKPMFLAGLARADSTVIAPGAVIGMPMGANATPYQLGPNLPAAMNAMNIQKEDMSESTQDKIMSGVVEKGVTAYATNRAEQNARVFLGIFGNMTGKLVRQVGELTMDCIIMHSTVGELDASLPESLQMRYKTVLAKGKERGSNITHRIVFTDKYMGRPMTEEQKSQQEWQLYYKAGGKDSDQRIWEVNPYRFARMQYTVTIDADKMIMRSMGADRDRKITAFQMMTNPIVMPFVDMPNVVEDFVIEEFSDGDPERYKKKGDVNQMMQGIMGPNGPMNGQPGAMPSPNNNGMGGVVVPPTQSIPGVRQ